ncbi:endonuclease SmrB [Buchnera aphidicola (Ceratovacuna keduensis)]|uniref:endonuclease SmrB n=1 Tax=Buchnera aphidicola TaxID=9 RepID=UPI0031B88BD2
MNNKNFISLNDLFLFKKSFENIDKMVQDNIFYYKKNVCKKKKKYKKKIFEKDFHKYFFSKKNFNSNLSYKPIRYVRSNCFIKKLKKLIYGKVFPEIFLDVHGMNIVQTKIELANLFTICYEKKISYISIIHGHGKEILKKQIPLWLSNHPDIVAFHEAPRFSGKSTSIFVIIDI